MENKNVLGLDLSLSCTGYSIVRYDQQSYLILDYGTIKTKQADFNNTIERLAHICEEIQNILDSNEIDIIVIEDSIPVKNSKSVLQVNVLKGMVIRTIQYNDKEIQLYYPSTVKKKVTGSGRASKEDVANAIKEKTNLDLEYSDKNNSKKTSDIFDSIALCICYLEK